MRFVTMLLAIALFLYSNPAQAHKVSVFAWVEGDTVHTQSKFSGGKKVKDGKIDVYDHLNKKVTDGVTDDQGYFAFPVDKTSRTLKIVLTAGMGHVNHWLVTAGELGHAQTAATNQAPSVKSAPTPSIGPLPNEAALEKVIERVVEKELAPIKARLAEQAWGLRDIVAGIGYIIGLMGLASYLNYRKTAPRIESSSTTSQMDVDQRP